MASRAAGVGIAAGENGQGASLGSFGATGDGRVHHTDALLGQPCRQLSGPTARRSSSRPRSRPREAPRRSHQARISPARDRASQTRRSIPRRHHARPRRACGPWHPARPTAARVRGCGTHRHLMAGIEQMAGHRRAHRPQPDHRDSHARSLPRRILRRCDWRRRSWMGIQQLALEQRRTARRRARSGTSAISRGICGSTRGARTSGRSGTGARTDGPRLVVARGRTGSNRLEHDVHPDHLHLFDEILAEPGGRRRVRVRRRRRATGRARPAWLRAARRAHALPGAGRSPSGPSRRRLQPGFATERSTSQRRPGASRDPSGRVGTLAPHRGELRTGAWRNGPIVTSLDCVIEAPGGRFAASASAGSTTHTT